MRSKKRGISLWLWCIKWQNHSTGKGPDFQDFLDKFVEQGYKLIDPEAEAGKSSSKKRKAPVEKNGPSPKRAQKLSKWTHAAGFWDLEAGASSHAGRAGQGWSPV